ncbi:MAG: TlpA disulfide reductase family protein [Peptoniphilus harei]|nr:TlpA disulfide reductase family protein [Peptoniphilus harei]
MKKLFKILILFAVALSLFACNKKTEDNPKETNSKETTEKTAAAIDLEDMPIEKFDFQTLEIENGDVVKSEDFYKEKPLTLVNVWGTFCGPCKAEMPDLAALGEEYKDKINFLGVVVDTNASMDTNVEEALEIMKNAGVTYTNIMPNPTTEDSLVNITAIPTTFFVNSEGKVLGGFVGQKDKESIAATIDKLLEENK